MAKVPSWVKGQVEEAVKNFVKSLEKGKCFTTVGFLPHLVNNYPHAWNMLQATCGRGGKGGRCYYSAVTYVSQRIDDLRGKGQVGLKSPGPFPPSDRCKHVFAGSYKGDGFAKASKSFGNPVARHWVKDC